ncbi:MAG: 16S rRNA (cytosine(1402)-N(4))-methyltransferase [Bacteroidetes bacterium 4572_112]|nr:MAG: 16S rRNA (cytosine(1402)-N(4))-methyltransferase [Bacteroidetes bacterium 4572_112]
MSHYHTPVMLDQCIEAMNLSQGKIFVDVTYGGGGHSAAILKNLSEDAKLYAFDQDAEAHANKIDDKRLTLIGQNFKYLKNYISLYRATPVDAILADLGVSSHQFDKGERGFSTRFDGPLDMRMDSSKGQTAADLLNNIETQDLIDIFRNYGELRNAFKSANAIIEFRKSNELKTTADLKVALQSCAPRGKENRYYAQIFQAIRIELNQELEALKSMLEQSLKVLRPGGRLVVMSYHSLEDRLVKNFIKSGNFEGKIEKDFFGKPIVPFKLISRKPITADEQELEINSRSRSAKLRIAEKL